MRLVSQVFSICTEAKRIRPQRVAPYRHTTGAARGGAHRRVLPRAAHTPHETQRQKKAWFPSKIAYQRRESPIKTPPRQRAQAACTVIFHEQRSHLHTMRMVYFFITIYQYISRMVMPRTCRFHPSCSQYTEEALHKYGFAKGILKSAWRIVRCSPFSRGGYDPVR